MLNADIASTQGAEIDFLSKNQTVELLKSYSKFIGSKIFENESVNHIKKDKDKYKLLTSKRLVIADNVVL